MITTLVVFLLVVSCVADAHELCADSLDPADVTMSFCSDYSGRSCCSKDRDYQLAAQYEAIKFLSSTSNTNCSSFLRTLFCGECDPYSAHFYGVEINAQLSAVPKLCDYYCQLLYEACKDMYIDWSGFIDASTLKQSPFGITQGSLTEKYATSKLFCKLFAAPTGFGVCYSGKKVDPPQPKPIAEQTSGSCVEFIGNNSMDPAKMIVSIISAHDGDSERIFVQYKRGIIEIWNRTNGAVLGTFLQFAFPILNSDGEAGFTSLVFHPKYAENGRFFVVRVFVCNHNSNTN